MGVVQRNKGRIVNDAATVASSGDLTAHAGGGQANAVQLVYGVNHVPTIDSNADSVRLPAAIAGSTVIVNNADGAQSLAVFPASGEQINGIKPDASISVAHGNIVTLVCTHAGDWYMSASYGWAD